MGIKFGFISIVIILTLCSCSNVNIELEEDISSTIEEENIDIPETNMEVNDFPKELGNIVVVGTNGKSITYEFIDGKPTIISEGVDDMGVGCPYAMWVEPDTNHRVVFGIMIDAKTWNIDVGKFDSIPVEWREYISRIFDLEGKYNNI